MNALNQSQLQYQVLLASAAQEGGLAEVDHLVTVEHVNVNGGDVFEEAPLHWAAACGHHKVVQFLLENGAEVDKRHVKSQETPLHWACSSGFVEAARVLFEFGANGRLLDNKQQTPLEAATAESQWPIVEYYIEHQPKLLDTHPGLCYRITVAGELELLKKYLKIQDGNALSFCWAIRHNALEMVMAFLQSNLSLLDPDRTIGESPMSMACRDQLQDSLFLILRSRPDIWEDLSPKLAHLKPKLI